MSWNSNTNEVVISNSWRLIMTLVFYSKKMCGYETTHCPHVLVLFFKFSRFQMVQLKTCLLILLWILMEHNWEKWCRCCNLWRARWSFSRLWRSIYWIPRGELFVSDSYKSLNIDGFLRFPHKNYGTPAFLSLSTMLKWFSYYGFLV